MTYKTIRKYAEAVYSEKKSDFIGQISPAKTEESALAFIAETKAKHRRAKHNCYAYIIRGETARYSEDGEPAGTAPVLSVLQKSELSDVVCVVTRYFGGILLGAGGLTRAYTKAVTAAAENAEIAVMTETAVISLCTDYSFYGSIGGVVSEYGGKVLTEEFGENVNVTVHVPCDKAAAFCAGITDLSKGKFLPVAGGKVWAEL